MRNRKKRSFSSTNNSTTYVIGDETSFYINEAYRAARTNLSFALKDVVGCKMVAITSAAAGDGKTTTAINLAVSISQANKRVLLIDADMRKGSVRRYLDLQRSSGLSSILSGMSTAVNEAICKTSLGFDCMTSGPIPTNPSELLLSETTKTMLDILSKHYDYIIIDTPPIKVVSDALALSKLVAGFVITVNEMNTTIPLIKETVKSLNFSDAKILGFIYNNNSEENRAMYNYEYK